MTWSSEAETSCQGTISFRTTSRTSSITRARVDLLCGWATVCAAVAIGGSTTSTVVADSPHAPRTEHTRAFTTWVPTVIRESGFTNFRERTPRLLGSHLEQWGAVYAVYRDRECSNVDRVCGFPTREAQHDDRLVAWYGAADWWLDNRDCRRSICWGHGRLRDQCWSPHRNEYGGISDPQNVGLPTITCTGFPRNRFTPCEFVLNDSRASTRASRTRGCSGSPQRCHLAAMGPSVGRP